MIFIFFNLDATMHVYTKQTFDRIIAKDMERIEDILIMQQFFLIYQQV